MASTTATQKTNREGLAALDEAFQAGAATLQRLEEQGEHLHQTEIVADSNKYLLDRSAREIRGMTWSGWLQNQFTSGPAVPKPPPAPARAEVSTPVEKRHVLLLQYEKQRVEELEELRPREERGPQRRRAIAGQLIHVGTH